MAMLACPHCGGPGISMMRKMALGPAIPATCRSCQRKIGVPWSSMVIAIPLIFAIFVFNLSSSALVGIGALVLGGIAMVVMQARYVPLEKR